MSSWYMHVCDVCRLLDQDGRLKFCFYCPVCDAWICERDVADWGRRGRAAALGMVERFNHGLHA
jgi:hypothetical protein